MKVRLLWLTVFRTVAISLVLMALGVQLSSEDPGPVELSTGDLASFAVIGLSYALTLITAVLLRFGRIGFGAAWGSIVFDVMLAASVVFLTGGSKSPFTFLFLVSIVGAAVLLGSRGAVVGFLGAVSAYFMVLALVPSSLASTNLPRFVLETGTQVLSQLLIAVLAGYVGEQLTRTGGRLESSQRYLRTLTELQNEIVNAIPSGLITCDAPGLVTYVNPSAASILGVTPAETVGKKDVEVVLPGVRSRELGRRTELVVPSSRGERTLGLSTAELDGGGLLIVFQDLTELRRVEQELDKIDHLATLGRFSAQLAHEIRNPLAAMRGSAQMLVSDSAQGPQQRLANVILRESDRLAALVEGYLKLARPPPPVMVRTRLDVVVRETLELLRADVAFSSVRVEELLHPLEVSCDAGQVKQMLLNLLRNAAAAVAGGGQIRVRVLPKGESPCLEVWDSAGSIAPEDRTRIFEPFFSRSRGGSGLGLSTVHSIVQAHGATITVESSSSTGTTFAVKFKPLGTNDEKHHAFSKTSDMSGEPGRVIEEQSHGANLGG